MKKLFKKTFTYRRLEHMPYYMHWVVIVTTMFLLGVIIAWGCVALFTRIDEGTLFKGSIHADTPESTLLNERLLGTVSERITRLEVTRRSRAEIGTGVANPAPPPALLE